MQLEFYWDDAGDPRARCLGPGAVLAGFLESDVQGSVRHGREILRAIDRIEAGKLDRWESTGNAYTLTVSSEGASLVSELDDDGKSYEFPLAQLREAVAGWTAFVEAR